MRPVKKREDSLTEQQYFVRPTHINHYGRLFGGQLLYWIDELAAIDNLQFKAPAHVGDMVVL